MPTRLHLLALLIAAAGGLTAAPTQGADATLPRDLPPSPIDGTETWSLRPTKVAAAAALASARTKPATLTDLPDARRSVRVVYEGYREAGPLRAAR